MQRQTTEVMKRKVRRCGAKHSKRLENPRYVQLKYNGQNTLLIGTYLPQSEMSHLHMHRCENSQVSLAPISFTYIQS